MRYEDLRKKEFLGLLKKLSINSCVYCNSQLAIVIDLEYYKSRKKRGQVKERKGLLELDHFYPKVKYPFLSTSFFNLQPSCSSCNKAKSDEVALFNLYTESDDLDIFEFKLDDEVYNNFWKKKDIEDIKFTFKAIRAEHDKLFTNHTSLFRIQEIYETQKDIIVELIHKKKAYSEAYKRSLIKTFESLFPDKSMINQLIIGNYENPNEIHKRPMSKFTQDIAKDLKLI
jgi:hypothetical protein